MDPKVCGKLLTHHRKGSKVDVEPLRDRFPLRRSTGEGLQMGSLENRNLRQRKKYFVDSHWGFLIFLEFIVVELGQTELCGSHEVPGCACPPQARPGASWAPPGASGLLPKLLVFILANKKSSKSLVLIFCKTKTGQKTKTGTGH